MKECTPEVVCKGIGELAIAVDKTASAPADVKKKKFSGRQNRQARSPALFAVLPLTMAIAAIPTRSAFAFDVTVNSQQELLDAIANANASTDANATIRLGSSFQAPVMLTTASRPITLDTQNFTLTSSSTVWSGPFAIAGSVIGAPVGTAGGGAGLQVSGVSTSAVNNGSITGGSAAAGQTGGIGLIENAGTLVNNGSITGGSSSTTGTAGFGAQIGHGSTLINNGTIVGGSTNGGIAINGAGINWSVLGATLINNGTIRGGSDLTGANVGGAAIIIRSNTTPVVNAGTMVGGNGAVAVTANSGNISLINSGTIQAGSGQANAIQLTPGNTTGTVTLELRAGSTIIGNVVGNAAKTGNTLTLGGTANDVFDVSSVGSTGQYRNFDTFQKTGASTWALTGNGTSATPWVIQQGTLQIGNGGTSGSILGDVADNAALAFNRSDAFTFGNLIAGTGSVNQVGAGTTIVTAANNYSGGTNVLAGALAVGDAAHTNATVGSGLTTVAAGAALGGYGTVSGSVNNSGTVAAANALAAFASGATGVLRIGGDLNNAGVVNLAAVSGRSGNVLNVAGNYTGTNGLVVLNTLLNDGGAASQTDRLVVGGNVSGTTAIRLNQSGTGALTVGDGIQLVQVNGTSSANSFHLAGPVQAGAFQYLLFQGGASDANDWYLRSQLAAQTTPNGTADPTSSPSAGTTAAAPVAYRPAVVGYTVTPLLNADYGFSVLGSLHERVGDIPNADSTQPAHSNGVWGRIGGRNLDADANDRFSADERTFFAQFGKDWTLSRDANGGSTHAGATLAFGSTSATFSDSARSLLGTSDSTGTVETQAQSIGGYWTKYLPDGSYFDGVGQLTHYRNRYGDIFGDSGSQNGFGAGVSGEVGKPFALGSSGVAIEPQAQLLYQYLHLNAFDDGISRISSDTTNGLRGRLGFRLFRANLSNDSKTSFVTPYFTADVLHDFFSPGRTTVGGTPFDNELAKTWYAIGLGVAGSFGKHSEVYANVKYEHSLGGEYRRNVLGQAGYRFNW